MAAGLRSPRRFLLLVLLLLATQLQSARAQPRTIRLGYMATRYIQTEREKERKERIKEEEERESFLLCKGPNGFFIPTTCARHDACV